MASYTKQLLSASANGKCILIGTTGTSAFTTIHTAVSGTNALDEIYLYAVNSVGSNLSLTVQWGGTTAADAFTTTIPSNGAGRILIADGRLLQNSLIVNAYTTQAGTNVLSVDGFVNRIQ